jgi:uncharacterized protein YjbI with pentapeptide repeats
MPGADLLRVNGRECRFTGAQLFGVNLSQGHFEGASFKDANLVGATLSGAVFTGADFRGASLIHASLAGADLSAAKGLTQDQLDQACSNAATRVPAGLVARACKGDPRVIILRSSPVHGGAPKYLIQPF